MRLFGLLAWYDESHADLSRALRSCAGSVDHIIARDGRYKLYAPDRPVVSDPQQADWIRQLCEAHGMASTIVTPNAPWDSEGHKRQTMFRLAEAYGTIGRDWVLPIDADEELQQTPGLRGFLKATQYDCIAFQYRTPDVEMSAEEREITNAGTDTRSVAITRLLRLQRDMRVEPPTHFRFTSDDGMGGRRKLWVADITLSDFHILHHTMSRDIERKTDKAHYIAARTAAGEE